MLGDMDSSSRLLRPRRGVAVLALLAAVGLTAAACGSSGASGTKRPESQPSEGGKTLAAVWPLTGLPAGSRTPTHPVIAVKIPNTDQAYPQTGLGDADMVSEELVEGGITRLAAFYYSKVPAIAGPVRSMRASDIGIVKPLHAVLVSSGAAPPTLRRLARAHVTYYEGGPWYYRTADRVAPYNYFVHLGALAKTLKKKAIVPANYLPWGTQKDFSGVQKARHVAVRFSGFRTTEWSYGGGVYTNTNSYEPKGDQFKPSTVLVLRVREGNAGYLDPAGNSVPETIFHGTGPVLIFNHGQLERGTWSKKRLDSPLRLKTAAGPLKIPAGHVFIELDPGNKFGGSVTWSR